MPEKPPPPNPPPPRDVYDGSGADSHGVFGMLLVVVLILVVAVLFGRYLVPWCPV